MTTFVDLETAKATRGIRLVTLAGTPSPWSEAAKGLLLLKKLPFVAVRLGPRDEAIREWTKIRNAPAVMFDDEPPRSGWAEILALFERLAPEPSLVPDDAVARVKMLGLAHEVMDEGGLLWSFRSLTIHEGLATNGARGFALPAAKYLGVRYVDSPQRVARARARTIEGSALLAAALEDREYYFGDAPTALDVYSAAALNALALPPPEHCPIAQPIRDAFASVNATLPPPPASLVAHRDRMYQRHLELPIAL